MPKPISFEQVIVSLYEAAADASLWTPALAQLVDWFGPAFAAHCFLRDSHRKVDFSAVSTSELAGANDDYARYYAYIDPRMEWVDRQPAGTRFNCARYFDDAFVARSEFYQDFLMPMGGRYVMGAKLIDANALNAVLSIHRSPRQGPFEEADLAQYARIQPHLVQAFRLFHKLNAAEASRLHLASAMDHVACGVIVTDRDGRIIEMNAAAAAYLKAGDGLRAINNHLIATDAKQDAVLQRGISGACAAAGGSAGAAGGLVRVDRKSGRSHLNLLVAPLRQAAHPLAAAAPSAILFVEDSERRAVLPAAWLKQLYGLTPAEAAVALAIADGQTAAEIAAAHRVTKNTVRVQTQSALAKTGARRQSDLVRLISRIPSMR